MTASVSAVPAIETRGLRKAYGPVLALASLDLRVGPGEVVGLLGPNGAGKTTAVKLLLGLVRKSGGEGSVLGRPLGDRGARSRIGYLPELFRYQAWLTADEVLHLHAGLAGLPGPRRGPEIARVLGLVGLADRAHDRVGGFSKGMQQRLGLAVALLGDPALVILDEPTSALDPVGRDDVRTIIRDARARGSALLLNSHLLGEVERLCDRAVIVNRGSVVASGTLAELLGESAVRLRVTGLPADLTPLRAFGPLTDEDGWLVVRPVDAGRIPDLVAVIVAMGGRVHAVDPARRTLEELFLDVVRGPGAGASPGALVHPAPPDRPMPPPPPTAAGPWVTR
ncbi:MAG: ABC transporter ATP-binding protein [Candidatus Limnocylindrales bacterium]